MTVDADFYYNIFCGSEQPELDRLMKRAERELERVILSPASGETAERQWAFAVCAQAEYMGLCGGIDAWAVSVSGTVQSFSVGSFSMSEGGSANGSGGSGNSAGICSRAMEYLSRGGLLYRGCRAW